MVDTPAGAAAAGGGAAAELGVTAERSYAALAEKREARAAKDAFIERQASQLTRHLLRERESEIQQRLTKDSAVSRVNHERILQRLAEDTHGKETEGVVAREVSRQIYDQLQRRRRLQAEEGDRKRAEEAERSKWMQARSLCEKMSLEGRLRELERASQERADQIRAKQREQEDRAKEVDRQESERKQTWQAHSQEQAVKAEQRRQIETRELVEKTRSQRSATARRQGEVAQRRKQKEEERCEGFRQSSTRWKERLQQHKTAERAADEERSADLLEKERARHDDPGSEAAESEAAQHELQRGRGGRRTALPESTGPFAARHASESTLEPSRPQEKPAPPPQATPYWSPDLAQVHARVKKQYVQRIMELDQTTERAFSTKKFKALAGAAKDDQDPQTARLQALYNMYVSKTPRDKKEDAVTTMGSTMSSTWSASARRVKQCGLCGREFLLECLPGVAPREAVDRLRAEKENAAAALAGQGAAQHGGARAAAPHQPTPDATPRVAWTSEGAATPGATPRLRVASAEVGSPLPPVRHVATPRTPQTARGPASRCYEEQVRLCEPCWVSVRMRKI